MSTTHDRRVSKFTSTRCVKSKHESGRLWRCDSLQRLSWVCRIHQTNTYDGSLPDTTWGHLKVACAFRNQELSFSNSYMLVCRGWYWKGWYQPQESRWWADNDHRRKVKCKYLDSLNQSCTFTETGRLGLRLLIKWRFRAMSGSSVVVYSTSASILCEKLG